MSGPLSRIRILDLTRVLAGPWATQMLADLGADVIKVERPGMGDDTRHWGPPWLRSSEGSDMEDSTYFSSANRNKRSIAVDLSTESGSRLIREMVGHCDVLIENYKVGDLKRYGLSWDDLRRINPRLIYCSITGYGQDGPYADKPGYDYIFQAEGGLMSINGEADEKLGGGPMKSSIAVTDVLTGLNACIAVLAAIENRHHTDAGQFIDVSLLDTIVHYASNQVVGYLTTGDLPRRWGNAHPNLTPYQPFKTADGQIIIACGNDGQFKELSALLGRAEWANDERFRRMSGRNKNRVELLEMLSAVFLARPTSFWVSLLHGSSVPNGGINTYDQVFEHPQVVHRQLRVVQDRGMGEKISTVRNPIRLSETPVEYRYAPPRRAQHTAEVLREILGLSPDQLSKLSRESAIEMREAADAPFAGGSGLLNAGAS